MVADELDETLVAVTNGPRGSICTSQLSSTCVARLPRQIRCDART